MLIGTVVQLQIQRSSLKISGDQGRYYHTAPIEQVSSIELQTGGVVGRDEHGQSTIDVHHGDHPMSKKREDNGISVGFVSHYELMRQRVGDHLSNGLAGENILIETDQLFTQDDLPERLWIESASGGLIELVDVRAAEPCVEFTKFCLRYPPEQKPDRAVTETLDFLRRGMRGYYATYLGAPAVVNSGDRLILHS